MKAFMKPKGARMRTPGLTRRAFLDRATRLSLLAMLVPWRAACASSGSRVIVVGAGISGLAAARELVNRGHAVTIVEGRDRVGGRIWTDRSLGVPVDCGASWIHGVRGNPLTELTGQFGIRTVPTDFDAAPLYDIDGTEVPDALLERALEKMERFVRDARRESGPDRGIGLALRESIQERITDERMQRIVTWLVRSEISVEYATDSETISREHYDEDEQYPGHHVVFPDGYGSLVRALADQLARDGVEFQLNQPVRLIRTTTQAARVETAQSSFEGDSVIVTLPLGVLKAGTVRFEPELPDWKRQTIQRLGFGTMNKVFLRFPNIFWPQDAHFIGFVAERAGRFPEFLNYSVYNGQPLLMAFSAGRSAHFEGTDAQVAAEARAVLGRNFGQIPDASAFVVTRWHRDPFALGSYSHWAVGTSSDEFRALGRPIGRLFFAGEACNPTYFATVHGALQSGRAAANLAHRQIS